MATAEVSRSSYQDTKDFPVKEIPTIPEDDRSTQFSHESTYQVDLCLSNPSKGMQAWQFLQDFQKGKLELAGTFLSKT